MKGLYKLLGSIMAVCFTAMILLGTFSVVKNSFFEHGKPTTSQHVAVVDISGIITSSASFVRQVEDLLEKKHVKALVVRINSPGGLVGPSQEMFDVLVRADKKIPVVASMGSVAASGGYYAALGARKIYANAGTLTASIGVIMEFMNTEKLYEWAKVERFTMKAGKLKDVGSPQRKMTPEEKEFIQALLNDVHLQFRGTVKERRKVDEQTVETYADGRVMTGQQAQAVKLVDTVGGFPDAILEAKKLAGLPENAPVFYPDVKRGILRDMLFGESEEESSFSRFFRSASDLGERFKTGAPKWRLLMLSPVG